MERLGFEPRQSISRTCTPPIYLFIYLFIKRLYLFIFRERERNINVWLPLQQLLLGTWPATQACALTGNPTNDPLVRRPSLTSLSHTSQGTPSFTFFVKRFY